MNFQETVDYIINIPKFANEQGTRGKSGNENLRYIMSLLGNPQDKTECVHIAGTNGKGSTATFTANILRELNFNVGIFTSPHLVKINERISVNGEAISDDDFLGCFDEVYAACDEAIRDGYVNLSFFEYVFAIAAVYFAKKKVDIVVYETGLGGRLDATNIIKPRACAITSIGLDHMAYLGDTIEKIAAEKAGIIKENIPVVYNTGAAEADAVIEDTANKKNAFALNVKDTNYVIDKIESNSIDFSISNRYYKYQCLKLRNQCALYQVDNAATAIALCNMLYPHGEATFMHDSTEKTVPDGMHDSAKKTVTDDMHDSTEKTVPDGMYDGAKKTVSSGIDINVIQRALDIFSWPGRMEKLDDLVTVDGAHNLDAIERFVESVRNVEFDESGKLSEICLLFAVAGDKDYRPMIKCLCENLNIGTVVVTTLNSSRGISAEYIADIFKTTFANSLANSFTKSFIIEKIPEISAVNDIYEAFTDCRDKAKNTGCRLYCVGSLYLVGSIEEINSCEHRRN